MIADYLQIFGVKKILGYDPLADEKTLGEHGIFKSDLDRVLSSSDCINVNLVFSSATRQFIGKKHFEMMKQDVIFLNT